MILSQGYYFDLECSDCGNSQYIEGESKTDAIKKARKAGWSLSQSTHACWCGDCKETHQYTTKMKWNSGISSQS